MTINSTTRKTNNLAGNGNTATFPFAFKVFTEADIVVKKLEVSTSVETLLTLGASNDYTVSLNPDQNGNPGGSVTLRQSNSNFNLPSGFQLVITSALEPLQGTDLTNQGGFYPEVINDALDKSVILHQQQQDELDRSIKFSLTNTIGSLEITENAAARANKVMAFDNAGEFSILSELGTYRGNWSASRAYFVRDLVKDTSTNNIFMCNAGHTSSGAQPLTTNTDSAKWDLIVDAATATTSSTNAASSATAAASSASAASASQSAAASSQTAAANSATAAASSASTASTKATQADTAKTAAQAAQTAAETALDSFDDRYLGAKSSNPTLDNDGNALIDGALYFNTTVNRMRVYDLGNTAWLEVTIVGSDLANVNTVAGSISNVNTVAGSISGVNAVANNASNINAVNSNSSNINTVAGSISNVNAVASNASNVNTVASNIANVNAIGADIAKIQTVANDLNETVSEIETVANDLNETQSEIDTVAANIANVNLVGNNIANINAIGTVLAGQTTYTITVQSGVFYVDGVSKPTLALIRGYTYIFNQADNSNSNHPIAFKDGSGNSYTSGVTVNGTAGQAGANVTFVVPSNAPSSLRYYCTVHGNSMGNTISVGDDNIALVAGNMTNVNLVGGSIANVNNVGNSIANVNTVASNLSGVNSFANRYRTDNTGNNPSSNNDAGDLFYNQQSGKLLVYNGVTSAWEETQSVGNFFINTIGNFSGTGGNSATFNNSAYKFTLSNAGQFAQQMLVSINGVVQKPNSGTGQPSEGFALDGANIVFAAPPPTGADYFIVTIGASVSIGTPSDNTVTSAKIVDGTIVNGDISSSAAIALSKLSTSGTPNNTNFLRGDGAWTVVNTDLVSDSSPQLGGDLQSNGNDIDFADNDKAIFGTGSDLQIYHDGSASHIKQITDGQYLNIHTNDFWLGNAAGNETYIIANHDNGVDLYYDNVKTFHTKQNGVVVEGTEGASAILELRGDQGDDNNDYFRIVGGGGYFYAQNYASGSWETHVAYVGNGAVELYHDNSKKFETVSNGNKAHGHYFADDGNKIQLGTSQDLQIFHDGSHSYIEANNTGSLIVGTVHDAPIFFPTNNVNRAKLTEAGHFIPVANNSYDLGTSSERWRNVYTNDLNLSNEGGANDVDGTWGSFTIQEGAEDLFLVNKRNGKKYKFNLTEVS
jgi:hypothetical protein